MADDCIGLQMDSFTTLYNVCSTVGVFSAVGDIMSTVGGVQYRGGYHEYRGGYLEYRGVLSTMGVYHDARGGGIS